MSDPQSPSNPEVQELTDLARRFAETGRYEESADLLLLALRLEPKNLSVKLGLAEIRKLQQQHKGSSSRSLRDILREGFRRNAIDAAHFLGLAHLYAEKGENARAIECIEVAKAKDLANPANHKLHGRLLFRRRDFDGAAEEFGRALRYNPFDRETAESLGRAEYERKQFEPALGATVHAFLLLNDGDEEGVRRLRRRIQTLKQILGWGNRELPAGLPRAAGAAAHRLRPAGVAPRALPRAGRAAGRRHLADPAAAAEARRGRRPARAGLPAAAASSRSPTSPTSRSSASPRPSARRSTTSAAWSSATARRAATSTCSSAGRSPSSAPPPTAPSRWASSRPATSSARRASSPARSATPTPSPPRRARCSASTRPALDNLIESSPELGVQVYWTLWHSLARKLRGDQRPAEVLLRLGRRCRRTSCACASRPRECPPTCGSSRRTRSACSASRDCRAAS